jgi:hypothetical protein
VAAEPLAGGVVARPFAAVVGSSARRSTPTSTASQLDLVVARTEAGWVVFDRRH